METLVVVSQHRNQSYSRNRSQISDRFGSIPPQGFKGINCRTFDSRGTGAGILPFPSSPKQPPKEKKQSSPIAITKPSHKDRDEASCSELWAGPAYSNSPPPSSLPIPKFSLREKRSASLDLPSPPSLGIALPRTATKSAPSSPTRASSSSSSPESGFFLSTAFATQNLRRILNLDIPADE